MTKNHRVVARGWARAIGVAAIALSLAACGGGSSPVTADPTQRPSSTQVSATPTALAANLLQVCDHAQDAFRSGGLNDADQARALSAELQGMIDVAQPEAAQMLQSMVRAADAIAADGRTQARPALQQAQDDAYDQLQTVCVRAGSRVWGE